MTQNLPSKPITRRERAARVGVALAALAASKHYKLDDLSIEVYARVLADVRVEDVEAVCRAMEKVGEWMPKPSAIRAEAIERAVAARAVAMPAQMMGGRADYCADCHDTGWRYSSRGVAPCACRPTNPAFALRRP